jgi:hypothetical protein
MSSIRIPSNIIVKSKYTIGKEYMYEQNHSEYQGYYYEMNGKWFAGKEFNIDAPVLLKIIDKNINSLLSTAATYIYGQISKIKLDDFKVQSHFFQYDSNVRYFSYEINKNLIKEINQDTFNTISSNPLYRTIALSYTNGFNNKELAIAEIKIPGITTFAQTSYTPPPVEESGLLG